MSETDILLKREDGAGRIKRGHLIFKIARRFEFLNRDLRFLLCCLLEAVGE